MAEIRVMLRFDYPPPAGPESRQMWMLLNPDHLRTVTDLSDLIRGRYYPEQRGALCLYLHDCLLPPGESARLIRDNDVIRVQWHGHDPEEDDMNSGSQAHPSKKRSRQGFEEDAEDRPPILAKKPRKEMVVLDECEQEESSKSSRRKEKKKKVLEESSQEAFPEVSSGRSKHKKHSEVSASLKAAEKILNLLGSNQGSSAKRVRASSSSHQEPSISHQDPSEVSIQPITTIPLNTSSAMTLSLFAALSVKKKSGKCVTNIGTLSINNPSEMSLEPILTYSDKKPSNKSVKPAPSLSVKKSSETSLKLGYKPNREPPDSSDQISDSDSEPSTNRESSTKRKKPPKGLHKSRNVAGNKTQANHELPAEGATVSSPTDSSESSSDQQSSTKRKKPPKGLNKSGTVVSVNKTKPNPEPSNKNVTVSSPTDSSESSSDQQSSTKRKKPPKGLNKSGTVVSVTKTKPNPEPSTKNVTVSSPTDSSESSSEQESSTKLQKPPEGISKAGTVVSVHKTSPNMDPSANRARSSIDYSASSYDQELSTASKNPSGATRNPSYSASGRIVFSPEMRKSTDSSSDNGDIIRRLVDVGIAPPLNGMSQKPHGEASHPVSDLDTNIIQGPVTAPSISNVVPSCVNNGYVTGGIHQEHEPNPGQHDHGIGRGRGIFPRRGQGSLRFRGRGNRGKGRGFGNQFFHKYDAPPLKKQQLEEVATNTSVVYQNPPESPKKDYSAFPLLAAPPQVGKVIAFKILELNENYSPEVSDYKEGVVHRFNPVTQKIEVELISKLKRREPGKFDLVYNVEDGKQLVEFAAPPDCKIIEPWSSLITPRLVMEEGSEEETSPQPL